LNLNLNFLFKVKLFSYIHMQERVCRRKRARDWDRGGGTGCNLVAFVVVFLILKTENTSAKGNFCISAIIRTLLDNARDKERTICMCVCGREGVRDGWLVWLLL
jgi:hypothetical protein